MFHESLYLAVLTFLLLEFRASQAASGYNYERPTSAFSSPGVLGGHHFPAPLPTTVPLPPIPAIPPLPTARPSTHIQTQVQTLVQTHPSVASQAPSIISSYLPPSPSKFLPPNGAALSHYGSSPSAGLDQHNKDVSAIEQKIGYDLRFGNVDGAVTTTAGRAPLPSAQATAGPLRIPYGQQATTAGRAPLPSAQATAGPLRIPYGQQAFIQSLPGGVPYLTDERQLNQYAVIEIIDNDIEQQMQPILTTPFFDSFRARIGASGTGATSPLPEGQQTDSDSNAFIFAQQRIAQQQGAMTGDSIALGSGGLGYVRLPSGVVYLGSGSLGYISGQQRSESVREARTRTGAPMPDPLHFGHGPLGGLRI